MHIAKIKYEVFYSSFFPNAAEAKMFIEEVEDSKTKAKIVIHQCARLLWLADRIEDVAKNRPAFQIMFYLIAAEAISKIVFDYNRQDSSKKYVIKFFEEICDKKHHKFLSTSFTDNGKYLNLSEAIAYLYKIRCDVAHEGKYYEVSFNDNKRHTSIMASVLNPRFRVYCSHLDIRKIVIEGAIIGAKKIMKNNYPINE